MNKKIFSLITEEIYPKEMDRFLINDLKKENKDFYLVDLTKIVYKKNYNNSYSDISINSLAEFDDLLRLNNYFILHFKEDFKYRKIFKKFEKYNNNKYFYLNNDPIPINNYPYDKKINLILYHLKRYIKHPIRTIKVAKERLSKFNSMILNLKEFSVNSTDNDLCIPSCDFETFREISSKYKKEQNYHIFIDQNWPYHRDFDTWHALRDSEKYFSELRQFFDSIESETGKPVKIALHPRTKNKVGNYGKRELIRDNTCSSIYNSDLVIAHCSTAISFAVLMNKKLILLTSDDVTPLLDRIINNFSKALNISKLNISNQYKDLENYINKKEYDNYLEEYIVKKSIRLNKKKASSIIMDYLNKF